MKITVAKNRLYRQFFRHIYCCLIKKLSVVTVNYNSVAHFFNLKPTAKRNLREEESIMLIDLTILAYTVLGVYILLAVLGCLALFFPLMRMIYRLNDGLHGLPANRGNLSRGLGNSHV